MIKKGLMKTLAEVGKIKTGYKGEMKKSGTSGVEFQPPKKLDYFIVTTTERNKETGNLIENKAVMEKLGEKPRELKIRLPFDSVEKNFYTAFMAYNGNKKLCSGDGEKAIRFGEVAVKDGKLTVKGEEKTEIACDYENCPIALAGKCKVSGILSCYLLADDKNIGGVYKFRTHSWNAVSTISERLESFGDSVGKIAQGLPFLLVMLKKPTEEHGVINYVTIMIDGSDPKIQRYISSGCDIFQSFRQCAIEEKKIRYELGVDIKAIEDRAARDGFFEDKDDPEEVTAEFYSYSDEKPEPKIKGTSGESLASLVKKAAGNVETVEAETVTEKKVEPVAPASKPVAKPAPAKPSAPVKDEIDLF